MAYFLFGYDAEIACKEDLLVKRQRRRRDATVTIAVGSTLGILYNIYIWKTMIPYKLRLFGYSFEQSFI